jgi:hypothetical protein
MFIYYLTNKWKYIKSKGLSSTIYQIEIKKKLNLQQEENERNYKVMFCNKNTIDLNYIFYGQISS